MLLNRKLVFGQVSSWGEEGCMMGFVWAVVPERADRDAFTSMSISAVSV